jgi:hypothetical protein
MGYSNAISGENIKAAFFMNLGQFISFLPDVLFTSYGYSQEIEDLSVQIMRCKKQGRKVVGVGWGRSKDIERRLFSGLSACGVRAYCYPDEASSMPRLGPDDLVIATSGSATTKQTVEALDFVLDPRYNPRAEVFGFTSNLKPSGRERSILDAVKERDGTIIYIKGQEPTAVKDYFRRQMESPLPIAPMGTRTEFNEMNFYDGFVLQLSEFLKKRKFSFDPFFKRYVELSEYFSRLEESLNDETAQESLVRMIQDLARAKRVIAIASAYTGYIAQMVIGRGRHVYPRSVDVYAFNSNMQPIDTYIIPDTKILALTKRGHSTFTRDNTLAAHRLGADYSIITENSRAALARGTNKKIIEPDSSKYTHRIGKYELRPDQGEFVLGDCTMLAVGTLNGSTERDMERRHMPGYKKEL